MPLNIDYQAQSQILNRVVAIANFTKGLFVVFQIQCLAAYYYNPVKHRTWQCRHAALDSSILASDPPVCRSELRDYIDEWLWYYDT